MYQYCPAKYAITAAVVCALLVISVSINRHGNPSQREIQLGSQSLSSGKKVNISLDFVPSQHRHFLDCDDLFSGTSVADFKMSDTYASLVDKFQTVVQQSTQSERIEGNTFQQPTQYRVLHYLAQMPFVRRICETGFNVGHSSFNYLTANPRADVYSFDLGEHHYAELMSRYLNRTFPGRLRVSFGDSTVIVPDFVEAVKPRGFACDFIYVDGGHTYPVALADLWNLASIANVDGTNVIAFDDYPTLKAFERLFGWAWEDMRRWGYVKELMRCSFKNKQFQRGFVIGTVVKRPTGRLPSV